jgi:hypothetical protein
MTRRDRALLTLALTAAWIFGLALSPALAQQKVHEEYTKKILEFTTDPHFATKYVNYLPYSEGVPTPLEVLGHIAGAKDVLSYSADVYKYMRALAAATPRVKVFDVGKTEEGRDWIVVAVADEATIRDLDKYKEINAKLADPRKLTDAEVQALLKQAKPIYWATGGMHSGETGSVEMLMELAYRVAVDESPFIKTIRENAITLITPILEVDGRDKQVDVSMAKRKDPKANVPTRLLYWGKYVSHDNNRDNLGLSLALSRNIMKVFFDFHPIVMHDLHESASHLYISTGSGPYNAWPDPTVRIVAPPGLPRGRQRPRRACSAFDPRLHDGWAETRLLRGQRPQRHRPLLRDPGRGRRLDPDHLGRGRPGLVPAQPAPALDALVHPQQRQPPAERRPHRHEPRRVAQGQVPGELLPQKQAFRGQGPGRGPRGLRLPRRRPASRPGGPALAPAPGPGSRGPSGRQALQGQGRRICGRELRRPHGPALRAWPT